MPESGTELSSVDDNSLRRMGERVATLEERVAGVKTNTEVLRSTVHSINENMQLFVAAEQDCKNHLATLTGQVGKLTESIFPLTEGVRDFQRMQGELLEVVTGFERRRGVASFGKKLAAIIAGVGSLITLVGGLVVGILWMAQHLRVNP